MKHYDVGGQGKTHSIETWEKVIPIKEDRELEINHLKEINKELLEEHKEWAKITGRILVEALQGHYEYLKVVAANSRIIYKNGEPFINSEVITKAESQE